MIPIVIAAPNPPGRRLYFDNNTVEDLLTRYQWTGCTDIKLRDQVMSHAEELVRKVIVTHQLQKLCTGDRTVEDLMSEGWCQIETTLYKYRARPHCADCYNVWNPGLSSLHSTEQHEQTILTPTQVAELKLVCPTCWKQPSTLTYRGTAKVFNMWSQVARMSILAFIKKQNRDAKNREGLGQRSMHIGKPSGNTYQQFIAEAEEVFKHDAHALRIVGALKSLEASDLRPPNHGIILAICRMLGCSRNSVVNFLKQLRLRRDAFSVLEDGRVYPVVGGVSTEQT